MTQSIKQLYGNKLGATDGEIGHIKDFYFDDRNWAVRYLIADTGAWLPGRKVLIAPYALGALYQAGKLLIVNQTRKQIEDSPAIETHRPVSRQFEEEYYQYYGLPYYWQGEGIWGMSGFPIIEAPPKQTANTVIGPRQDNADNHLRSTEAVMGYNLQAENGNVGHIIDFVMNDKSWVIEQLVVRIGHRLSGKEVLIDTKKVQRISYPDSTIYVNQSKEAIEQGPVPHFTPLHVVN
jgi:sporulation protein YlmC with PRC-barrel domain